MCLSAIIDNEEVLANSGGVARWEKNTAWYDLLLVELVSTRIQFSVILKEKISCPP